MAHPGRGAGLPHHPERVIRQPLPETNVGPEWFGARRTSTSQARAGLRHGPVSHLLRGEMRVSVNIDELGPVDWIVVEFPGSKFNGEVAPVLKDYVDRGLIRILDLLILKKDADGAFEAFETSDLDDSEIGDLRGYETELAMLLSEQDVIDLAETVEPGSSAAVLVWENLWAAPFGTAVRHAGGQLTASGRIPIQAVIAAIEADEEEGA